MAARIDEQILDEMMFRIIGGESVRSMLKKENRPKGWPCEATFFNAMGQDEVLMQRYRAAQMLRAELLIDQISELADDTDYDYVDVEQLDKDGNVRTIKQWSGVRRQQRQLRIDTYKWIACKQIPRIFGEKIQQEITTPEAVSISVSVAKPKAKGEGDAS